MEERSTPSDAKAKADAIYGGDFKWPNLYEETHDMVVVSFFVYTFSYIRDVAKQLEAKGEKLEGYTLEHVADGLKSEATDSELVRTFSPEEVKRIILDNQMILSNYYESFKDVTPTITSLDRLIKRTEESGLDRPIELEEFDDTYQKKELVYTIIKDDLFKRIILVFRGTTNSLAFASDWGTNIQLWKKRVSVPDSLKGKLGKGRSRDDMLDLHTGFYEYLFMETEDDTDIKGFTKYDQIVSDVKSILDKNPGHKLYVTGHSLGGAMSTLGAFFLSCEPDDVIPKPVSCINFAAPRVGDRNFLRAVQYQEQTKKLRLCRAANEGDSVAFVNSVGYAHVGFQMKLFKARCCATKIEDPILHYPSMKLNMFQWLRISLRNSIVNSLNLTYDHGDYRARVENAQKYLEGKDLNEMYADPDIVGFDISK